jgi:hypothetical protein
MDFDAGIRQHVDQVRATFKHQSSVNR